MYEIVFNAHSGLRYLILLLGVLIAVFALIGMSRKQPADKTAITMMRVWTVLIDIQIVLGILTIITGRWYAQLIGHLFLMIGAAAVAHLGAVRLRKAEPAARSNGMLLATALVALGLMIAGIMAIGRPIVGSGAEDVASVFAITNEG